ncbi:MAG: ornithine carbamoyltransferase [Roseateles sp.]|uniref:ornithine carbamoyltransferase n=1 Tax=Roseateles sp. TaxID=1971397 RepID=UPI004036C318
MCSLARHLAPNADLTAPLTATALVAQARALADLDAVQLKPLRGKRLALFTMTPGDEGQRDFVTAATALGAQVSLVAPGLDESSSAEQIDAVARLLSELYDAIECQHLPEALVRRIAQGARIPVFFGLAMPGHPTAALTKDLGASLPPALRRCRILQAALVLSVNR